MEIINQNKEELIEYLINFADKHRIKCERINVNPAYHSVADKGRRIIFINMNWQRPAEIPFIIGHEIGHVLLTDDECEVRRKITFAEKNAEEKPADLFSLKLIYDFSRKKGDSFSDPGLFMQAYSIPPELASAVKALFKNEN